MVILLGNFGKISVNLPVISDNYDKRLVHHKMGCQYCRMICIPFSSVNERIIFIILIPKKRFKIEHKSTRELSHYIYKFAFRLICFP
jgi:hypothetical protein